MYIRIPENDYTSVLFTCIDLLLAWRSTSIVVEEGEGMIDVCVDVVDGEVGAAIPPLTISIVEGTAKRGMGENLYTNVIVTIGVMFWFNLTDGRCSSLIGR